MKALSAAELQNLAFELKRFIGGRLQEVRFRDSVLALGFYHEKLYWIVVDLNAVAPQVFGLSSLPPWWGKDEKKPVFNFLKAHFVGKRLQDVAVPPGLGRVLFLRFGERIEIEARLFPRGQNLVLHSEGKQVALSKPQVLQPVELIHELAKEFETGTKTSLLEVKAAEWLAERQTIRGEGKKSRVSPSGSRAEKIARAIGKVEVDLARRKELSWGAVGEWLKEHQTLAVSSEWEAYIDRNRGLADNIENCFQRAKETKLKILGAEERLCQLRADLERSGTDEVFDRPSEQEQPQAQLLAAAKARGRTLEIGKLVFYVGKSAADNLRLLREARPWYLWLHLRDVPSSHGILQKNKNQPVSDRELRDAANALIGHTFGEKHKNRNGEKFDVLVAECRFVRPVKGDRIGRVTYSNERVLAHRYEAKKG